MNESAIDRLYYGCGPNDTGHYFWAPENAWNRSSREMRDACPWGYDVDGELQPSGTRRQGLCKLHSKDGWTALAWWDSSKDKRPGSCSVYAQRGEHDFDAMVAAFRESFPWAFARMGFALELAR